MRKIARIDRSMRFDRVSEYVQCDASPSATKIECIVLAVTAMRLTLCVCRILMLGRTY